MIVEDVDDLVDVLHSSIVAHNASTSSSALFFSIAAPFLPTLLFFYSHTHTHTQPTNQPTNQSILQPNQPNPTQPKPNPNIKIPFALCLQARPLHLRGVR
jgi:cell division protein FtsN